MRRERGVVLIITYKVGKAAIFAVFAVVLAVLTYMGLGHRLLAFADDLRHHTGAWSLALAELVTRAATGRTLWTVVLALGADATMSLFEGWALWRGHAWGPWLVVVSTGSLLPFEIVALARHPHPVRAAVLAVNAAIVIYLVRKVRRDRVNSYKTEGPRAAPPSRSAR
jgi:uncharacterized membrane protein (DUF2068 family)